MQLIHECSDGGLRVMLVRGLNRDRGEAERKASETGVPLALMHRREWAQHLSRGESWFLFVVDSESQGQAGFAIEKVPTRAMPGHFIFRIGMFGANWPADVCEAAVAGLMQIAKTTPRLLRLQVNVFSRDKRGAVGDVLAAAGFHQVHPPTAYQHTLVVDLTPSEDEIFASLGKSARKRIRETTKLALRTVVLTDAAYADRLKELQQEALRKTDGPSAWSDWQGILSLSREHPHLSRVIGLFLSDDQAPENMVAFSWVCNHGDHGEYRAAGSTRKTDVRIPFGYLMVWDMIRWAKEMGASWFDMGGVALGGDDEKALEGISEFKGYFTRELVEVGAEWVLEPNPMMASIAARVSSTADRFRSLLGK
jgi:hypothetical protein